MALRFRCCTQNDAEDDHSLSARGGIQKNGQYLLPRWKQGSILTFTIDTESFPKHAGSDAEMNLLEAALIAAAHDWNSKGIGVYFRPALFGEPALFGVEYKHDSPMDSHDPENVTYAIAFFPNSRRRVLDVFGPALAAHRPRFLADIFRHEFGHILGLRHEDADRTEARKPSVQLEAPDPAAPSIMRSVFTPGRGVDIQPSDVAALRKLYYEWRDGHVQDGFQVVTIDPRRLRCYQPQPRPLIRALEEEDAIPGQASLVGKQTRFGGLGHAAMVAATCVVSVCVVLVFVMTPRITVTCSSHVHDGRQWGNWDGWCPRAG